MMALGIPNDYAISMMGKCEDPVVLLNMGMSNWLQQASSKVTLGVLARALRSPEVGEDHLASEIVKGKL